MAQYTIDDQEFFFETANKVLDRFGLLTDVNKESLVDVIEFYQDLLVNALDVFNSWKSACIKRHLENGTPPTEEEIEKQLEQMEKQSTTEALSQEC